MCILICVLLFLIGIIGIILNRSNIIIILMSIELLLLAIIYVFLLDNKGSLVNQVFIVMILTVAAAEAAIGLAIMVAYFRIGGTIAIKSLSLLYGNMMVIPIPQLCEQKYLNESTWISIFIISLLCFLG